MNELTDDASRDVTQPRRIGVYGGAFDPVHLGHLRCAFEVKQALNLDELRFVPTGTPPHRTGPRVSADHRIAMLESAVRLLPGVVIDEREVQNTQTSYTVDTLASIASEYAGSALTLIVGMDQFSEFDTWHRWRDLLDNYHLAVMERPGETISGVGQAILREDASRVDGGRVQIVTVTQLEISSSRIRDDLAHGRDIQFLVPTAVRGYIISNELYCAGQVT